MLPEFQVFIFAMAPLSELKGSIPMGLIVLNFPLWKAFLLSFLGNLVPVVILLFLFEPFSLYLRKKFKICQKFFDWLFQRTRKKIQSEIRKYGKIGLASFVALPFPLTGGWTGAVAAFLMGIPFKTAFSMISFGIFINGIIVSILTLLGITVEEYFGWQVLITIVAISFLIYLIFRKTSSRVQTGKTSSLF